MTSTDIVRAAGAFGVEGLEDFDESDIVMPTLRLGANQNAGFIINNLSNERFTELECIVLGIVKSRILWSADMSDEKEMPLCRSYDFALGYPNMDTFPWKASGFEAPMVAAGETAPQQILKCDDCRLQEWGTHPKQESPWCAEQHQYVILQKVGAETDGSGGVMVPAILTLQRTGLKPSRKYFSVFAQAKTPMFVTSTRITLDTLHRGTVDYTVPTFTRGTPIPESYYPEFADTYRRIRASLHTPYVGEVEEVPVAAPTSNVHNPAPAASATPPPQTVPENPPAAAPQNVAPPAAPAPTPPAPEPPVNSAPAAVPAASPVDVAPASVPAPAPDVAPSGPSPQEAPIVPDAVTPPPAAAPASTVTPGEPRDGDLPF